MQVVVEALRLLTATNGCGLHLQKMVMALLSGVLIISSSEEEVVALEKEEEDGPSGPAPRGRGGSGRTQ